MNKNNLFLFILLLAPSIVFAAAAPGKNVLQTALTLNVDYETMGKKLGEALAKTQVGLNMDHKAMGEALANLKLLDPKQLQDLLDSKELRETLERLKIIPANFSIAPINFSLTQMPHVPVDLTVKLSAENGRRIAGTAGATMATASILCTGLNCINCPLLVGSCIAMDPERAKYAASRICNEQNYEHLKDCCFATEKHARSAGSNCLSKCKTKPEQAEAKRD